MRVRGELLSPLVAIRAWCFRSCVSYLGALALPGRKLSISRAASYRDREGAAEKLEGGGGGQVRDCGGAGVKRKPMRKVRFFPPARLGARRTVTRSCAVSCSRCRYGSTHTPLHFHGCLSVCDPRHAAAASAQKNSAELAWAGEASPCLRGQGEGMGRC